MFSLAPSLFILPSFRVGVCIEGETEEESGPTCTSDTILYE